LRSTARESRVRNLAVIVMEMAANQSLMIPLMATSFLAFAVSRLVCRRPLYGAPARRFLAAQGGSGGGHWYIASKVITQFG
jgi:hypothetical protein